MTWDGLTERRVQADRRGGNRSGKLDRRKNRCGMCHWFPLDQLSLTINCPTRHIEVAADSFACPQFQRRQLVLS